MTGILGRTLLLLLLAESIVAHELPDVQEQLAAARKRLEELGEPKTDEDKSCRKAIAARVQLCEEYLQTRRPRRN